MAEWGSGGPSRCLNYLCPHGLKLLPKAGACCARCNTIWGTVDTEACSRHRSAGIVMDPRCEHCRYHGAYKFIFEPDVPKERRDALRRSTSPGTSRSGGR